MLSHPELGEGEQESTMPRLLSLILEIAETIRR